VTTRRASPLRQADIARALKAVKAAGLVVTGCRLTPAGEIDLQFASARPGETELEAWKASRRNDAR
jgi:hypothetical protein